MSDSVALTALQRARERSVTLGIGADLCILSGMTAIGLLGGSLTMIAETLRAWLALAVEYFSLIVLRRVHRGDLPRLEYGSGKLEQAVNVAVGASMIVAGAWIAWNASATLSGEREIGTPLGLAAAAIVGAVNWYINLLAWDGVRRAARGSVSLLMEAQVAVRLVKLVASCVVGITMAIAALSTDREIVVWADAAGGLFISAYMLVGGTRILREAIPDLLDHSPGDMVAATIQRVLERHRELFLQVERLRSRRSGRTVFIEAALGFRAGLTAAEVQSRIAVIRASLEREIAESDITLHAAAAELAPELGEVWSTA